MIGKVLQLIALFMLPVALFHFGFYEQNPKAELFLVLIGSILFLLGKKLETKQKS